MTAVASITRARSKARSKSQNAEANLRAQIFLVTSVGILLVIGLAATLSASSVVATARGEQWNAEFKTQAAFAVAGLVIMAVAAKVPYQWYRRLAMLAWAVSVVALVLVRTSGVAHGGAQRWLKIGFVEMQPSDFAKFAVIIALAFVYEKKERLKQLGDLGHFFVPTAAILGSVGLLVITQTDLGTTVVIVAAAFAVMIAAKTKTSHLGLLAAMGIATGALSLRMNDYQRLRVDAWRNPAADIQGIAYHVSQSKIAIGSGGPFGVGLGQSRFRWLYLPNAHTDFIFSIIAEELGFAGAVFAISLYLGFAVLGISTALRAPDRFGMMIATGITAWITVQAFVNIGGVTGMIPLTGITLPFVSAGGSSLLMAMGAVGVLLNIASQGAPGAKR